VFCREEHNYAFAPHRAFSGHLELHGYVVPAASSESEFVRDCPILFRDRRLGRWQAACGPYRIGMESNGPKLRSGRRSRKRRVVSIDVSWPHDPWRKV
jgi:hypothetical protein